MYILWKRKKNINFFLLLNNKNVKLQKQRYHIISGFGFMPPPPPPLHTKINFIITIFFFPSAGNEWVRVSGMSRRLYIFQSKWWKIKAWCSVFFSSSIFIQLFHTIPRSRFKTCHRGGGAVRVVINTPFFACKW